MSPRRRGQGPRGPGTVVYELRADDLISLAINVAQNGWDWRELRPHMFPLAADQSKERKGDSRRRSPGPVPALLEVVYREALRANHEYLQPF